MENYEKQILYCLNWLWKTKKVSARLVLHVDFRFVTFSQWRLVFFCDTQRCDPPGRVTFRLERRPFSRSFPKRKKKRGNTIVFDLSISNDSFLAVIYECNSLLVGGKLVGWSKIPRRFETRTSILIVYNLCNLIFSLLFDRQWEFWIDISNDLFGFI